MSINVLDESVLVLNKSYLALKVATAKSVMTILCKGLAKVVDENYVLYDFAQWCERSKYLIQHEAEMDKYAGVVHTPRMEIVIPQVIYLHASEVKVKGLLKVKYSRKNVFHRDENTCQYCGTEFPRGVLTVDHIIPRSRGGGNTFTNIVAACRDCNSRKGDKTPEEANMMLLSKPSSPRWKSYTGLPFSKAKSGYWDMFLQ